MNSEEIRQNFLKFFENRGHPDTAIVHMGANHWLRGEKWYF